MLFGVKEERNELLYSLYYLAFEPPGGDHPLCKKKWFPTGGGLPWELLNGNKRA